MPKDTQKSHLEVTAEVLTLAASLLIPEHNDPLRGNIRCEGSGQKPEKVYKNMHKEVGPITAFDQGGCCNIFALVPDGKSFRWEDQGVYGFYEDGRPYGP